VVVFVPLAVARVEAPWTATTGVLGEIACAVREVAIEAAEETVVGVERL
jgi:hypothetical protein